jgi:phenylacetate-coenzyme A ligase PaaK-like adenylate-forming protein
MEAWLWPPAYNDAYLPPASQLYWFPQRETMDAEQRDAAILDRIRDVMRYAHEHSGFYRRKWREVGLELGDVKSLGDFERVPVITKEELRRAQADQPPLGDYLCVPNDDVIRIHGTSGTTGRPTAFGIGADDWRAIANAHGRAMWAMGIRPTDTVFIGSIFSLYMGSWAALAGAERLGAAAFPFGAGVAGQTLRAVHWLAQIKPTVFYGTPTYALRLAEVAKEHAIDPRSFGIRILFFSGEPGASIPSIREQIQAAYGGEVFDSGSMAEMTPWTHLAETTAHAGMLCWQDIVYTEVVDPDTFQRVPFGSEGTPVYTHLERISQPMIRLLSGDLTRWEAGPSPCGRTYPILPKGIYGRIDDQFTVRGENIYPSAIDEIVSGLAQYGGEHRIIVSREETMDTLAVQIEYRRELNADQAKIEAFRATAASALRTTLGIRTTVVPVPQNTFDRTEFKARRVIDRRDLFRELVQERP